MEDIVIDTSVLVKILIYKDEELFRKINKFRVFVPANVVEETCFKVIVSLSAKKCLAYRKHKTRKTKLSSRRVKKYEDELHLSRCKLYSKRPHKF